MRTILLAALAASVLPGCGGGPKLAPVTGKVLYKGKGLTAGSIYLYPDEGNAWQGDRPSSVLQLDGSFTMGTHPHGPGVPPGKYKVLLGPPLASRLGKPEYASEANPPWRLEVPDEGANDVVFEVK